MGIENDVMGPNVLCNVYEVYTPDGCNEWNQDWQIYYLSGHLLAVYLWSSRIQLKNVVMARCALNSGKTDKSCLVAGFSNTDVKSALQPQCLAKEPP